MSKPQPSSTDGRDDSALSNLASSILQLRVDKTAAAPPPGRQAKHSPLVMTPGGSFVKAKGRMANLSPDDDEDEEDEAGEEGKMEVVLDPIIAAKGRAIAGAGPHSPTAASAGNQSNNKSPSSAAKTAAKTGNSSAEGQPRPTKLFDGAITMALPPSFEDISRVRQVPDHQEVYVDRQSEMSFIVEIVDYSKDVPNANAARYYFTDLAECNEAKSALLDSTAVASEASFIPNIADKTVVKCVLTGRQSVQKFNQPNAPVETVQIIMVVVRLPRVGADMLLSMNIPYAEHHSEVTADAIRGRCPKSPVISPTASAANAASPAVSIDAVFSTATTATATADITPTSTAVASAMDVDQGLAPASPAVSPAVTIMRAALDSLTINDWSLFA